MYLESSQSVRVNERKIMFKRTSFQNGSLKREKRKRGPDVWVLRWRETGPNGQPRKPKRIIGNVNDYPNLSSAKRAVAALGLDLNLHERAEEVKPTVMQLIAHYTSRELSSERASKHAVYLRGLSRLSEDLDCAAMG